ncbi:nucleotide exchange factor GrpE, partial [Candidatus Curtissbacteria bacterium]|nr:nucleotide exchange factor GrpE [Candidatus Curtissbacteria bacterium]
AVEMVDGKKGIVVEVLESGFKIHDKLLRAAKVKVGLGNKKRTV